MKLLSPRIALLATSATIALSLGNGAFAQQSAPASGAAATSAANTGVQQLDEVVITTSRVQRNGFTAPTPVTVLGADQVAARGATNVADILNEIPSFRPTQTPQARAIGGGFGANFVDLRGLNQPVPGTATTARTLVLVDGRRHVAATTAGEIDLNLIPSSLIERTEVVTGGASAEWGSDAIAGVVNLVVKTKMEGLQFNASVGGTDKRDDFSYNVNGAGGTSFAGGRGHIIAGGEYDSIAGVGNALTARNWSSQLYGLVSLPANRAAGLPAYIVSPNVHYSNQLAAAGIVTGGPLVNTTFNPDGSLARFTPGSLVGGNQQIGGDNANLNFSTGLNVFNPVQRYSLLTHATFDVTPDIQVFGELGYSNADQNALSAGRLNQANLTIQIDNPFVPAALRQQMIAAGVTSLPFGRFDSEIGRYKEHNYRDTENGVVGAKGSLPKGWSWDAYFQTGTTRSVQDLPNMTSTPNYLAAINAVAGPNGTVVCRSLVTARGVADPGCVPYNVFGVGAPSAAAIAYVTDDAKTTTFIHENVGAANIRGEPFTLPAGPVSVAVGGEYRLEATSVNADINQRLSRNDFGNSQPISGSYNVAEGYIATVVPILKDFSFIHSIDFNAAVRETKYSLSGSVTTWKYGATFEDESRQVRLRATSSRDIRAPNLQELYGAAASGTQNITDTVRSGVSTLTPVLTSGSTKLLPEIADTLTYGGVLSPKFIPGLTGSLDYYSINIAGVISTLGAQNIVNRCAGGVTSLCALITRDAAGNILSIANNNLNLNQLKTSGLDIEADYRLPISYIHLPGDMTARALGTHVFNLATTSAAGVQDYAGQQVPHWSWTFNVNYALDKFSSNVTVRRIGQAIIDVTKIGPDNPAYSPTLVNSVNRNIQPSIDYVDLQLQYTLMDKGAKHLVVYGVINNIFDQAPPGYGGSNLTSASLYDLVGRFMRVGVRLSY